MIINSTKYPVVSMLLFLCMYANGWNQLVTLKGFVPPEITTELINYEYSRIWRRVAPDVRPDKRSIEIVFFSDKRYASSDYTLPEWGGGGTIGAGLVIIPIDVKPLLERSFKQVLVHELVHIVLNRIDTGFTLPRWFHEGCAMVLSGDVNSSEEVLLSRTVFTNSFLTFGQIDSVNEFTAARASLAYAQSRQAVVYLIETYGIEVIAEIVAAAREKNSFRDGVAAVVGLDENELNRYYEDYVRSRYNAFLWLTDTTYVWIGVSFLFIVAFCVTVVRKRRKIREMARTEKEQSKSIETVETEGEIEIRASIDFQNDEDGDPERFGPSHKTPSDKE